MDYKIQPIPLGLAFSKNFFKDQISNSESLFLLKRGKRDVQVGALSFEHWKKEFINVTPNGTGCTSARTQNLGFECNFSNKLTVTTWWSSAYIPVSEQLPAKLTLVVCNMTIYTPGPFPNWFVHVRHKTVLDWRLSPSLCPGRQSVFDNCTF